MFSTSGALSALNKTMEETFMRFARSAGGFSGIFHMFVCLKDDVEQHQTGHNITKNYEKYVGLLMIRIAPKKGSPEGWTKLKLRRVRKKR